MELNKILLYAVRNKASDVHLTVGIPPVIRIDDELIKITENILSQEEVENYAKEMMTANQFSEFSKNLDIDFTYTVEDARFRVNVFIQRGSYAIAARVINTIVPSMDDLGLPEIFKEMIKKKKGLILVTGPTGSGKSTTIASMINYINKNYKRNIITLEDPIEYLHRHNKSIVNQREVGKDITKFSVALRAVLRQDPDIILVGEMRDIETIATVITAAETGHLVLSTLHTNGAANTVDRIIDVFPPHQQQQVRIQLANVVEGIISQQLIPKKSGKGRVAAFEIMMGTTAIRNLIREGKAFQITSVLQTGAKYGMQTMEMSLNKLIANNEISNSDAQRVLSMF